MAYENKNTGGRGSMTGRSSQKGNFNPANLPPLVNAAVMIKEYNPETLKAPKPDDNRDWVDVFLINNIPELGLKAEFDESGNPTKVMRMAMPPLPTEVGKDRRNIWSLSRKKSGGAAMSPGSLVTFEKTSLNKKTGFLNAKYARSGPTQDDRLSNIKQLLSCHYVCVAPEREYSEQDSKDKTKKNLKWAGNQHVYIADQFGAVPVVMGPTKLKDGYSMDNTQIVKIDEENSVEVFELENGSQSEVLVLEDGRKFAPVEVVEYRNFDEAVELLVASTGMGSPGFQLHARRVVADASPNASDEEKSKVAQLQSEVASDLSSRVAGFYAARVDRVVDEASGEATYVAKTPKGVVEAAWANPGMSAVKEVWDSQTTETDWEFEFVPMICVGQAKSLIPSENPAGPKDKSKLYRLYDEVDPQDFQPQAEIEKGGIRKEIPTVTLEDGRSLAPVDAGWSLSHATVERASEDSPVWYATYENTTSTRPLVHHLADIPTPNMPAYHLTAVKAEAARLLQNKIKYNAAIYAKTPEVDDSSDTPGLK